MREAKESRDGERLYKTEVDLGFIKERQDCFVEVHCIALKNQLFEEERIAAP